MSDNTIDKVRDEISSRPLVAIDIILEELAELKRRDSSENISEFLILLSQAILTGEGISRELWMEDPVDGLFNRELSGKERRFIGICLLRLLAANDDYFKQVNFSIKVFSLFDDVLSEDIYPLFNIEKRYQTYEKQSKLKDVVPSAENSLLNIISSLHDLEMFSTAKFREHFMQVLRNKKSKPILNPFLPNDLITARLDEIFGIVENYLGETERRIIPAFEKAKDTLEAYLLEADRYGTKYSREYLGGITKKLLELLQKHFAKNPLSKPARITVTKGEKKYPLFTEDRNFNLSFTIINNGSGHAFDVFLKVETNDLILEKSEFYLGNLGPSPAFVEVPVPVQVKHSIKTAYVIIEIDWTNFDKTSSKAEDDFALEGQRSDIDWDDLARKEPYDLEPVATADELVGRTEILNQLVAQVEAQRIVSSYIFGQKRVGKTSIANALKSRLIRSYSDNFLIVYLEGGEYITPEAKTTIQALGEILCDRIRESDKRFSSLGVPAFDNALAPLSRFLDSVLRVAPDYKILFILDEFDEIPNELCKSEDIGRPFFLTLRAISGKPLFGFVLVGGEKMEFILNYQGIVLNKFDSVRVDYFEKDKHLSDFRELVLKPLPQGIEMSDTALVSLYEQTAGNPFFTKLICRTLFKILVERKDSHVTRKEIEEATKLSARKERSERFQHFWMDGVFDTGSHAEAIKIARRRVLVALAEIFRQHSGACKDEIIERAKKLGLSESEIEVVLSDFVRRRILLHEQDTYTCKVPFFGEWLKETGVQEIINTLEDLDVLLQDQKQAEEKRIRSEEIVKWVKDREIFYRTQLINEDRVRVWLNQFKKSEDFYQFETNDQQRLMFHMLQHLTFYNRSRIRAKLKEAHGMVIRDLRNSEIFWSKEEGKRKRSDILISYLDEPGKSGANYAKLYAEENGIYRGEGGNVVEPGRLRQAFEWKRKLQALVFVDDFIGTGESTSEYFKKLAEEHGEVLRNSGLQIFFIALSGFIKGREKIEDRLDELYLPVHTRVCDLLDETAQCFSNTTRIFPNPLDRDRARKIAHHYGLKLENHAPLGYGDCEAAVVFEDSCPNNTLPILWAESKDWIPLFKRS